MESPNLKVSYDKETKLYSVDLDGAVRTTSDYMGAKMIIDRAFEYIVMRTQSKN